MLNLIRETIFHHPTIPDRFQVSPVHFQTLDNFKAYIETSTRSKVVISDYCIQLHDGEWIACIWFDCNRKIMQSELDSVVENIRSRKLYAASWWQDDLKVSRISIWLPVPELFIEHLFDMEKSWKERMSKAEIIILNG